MDKKSLVRFPDNVVLEVQKYAQDKGVKFASAVRMIVIEHLKESNPHLMDHVTE